MQIKDNRHKDTQQPSFDEFQRGLIVKNTQAGLRDANKLGDDEREQEP